MNKNNKFNDVGAAVYEGGYEPIPCNGKRPTVSGWQNTPIDEAVVERWGASEPSANVGIRCGVGTSPVYAADFDFYDADVCSAVVSSFVETFGKGIVRVGSAPKTLMLYSGLAGFKKLAKRWTDPTDLVHGFELLGAGQQFIALGTHPDTGKDYSWEGDSVLDVEAFELVELDLAAVAAWMDGIDSLVPSDWVLQGGGQLRGGQLDDVDDDLGDFEGLIAPQFDPIPPSRIVGMLSSIDNTEYEQWIKVGAAVYNWAKIDAGADGDVSVKGEAFKIWNEWSSTYAPSDEDKEGYSVSGCKKKWRSFKTMTDITVATLIALSRDVEAEEGEEALLSELMLRGIERNDLLSAVDGIVSKLRFALVTALGNDVRREVERLEFDRLAIIKMLTTCYWSSTKSQVVFVNKAGNYVVFKEKDAFGAMVDTFGAVVSHSALSDLIQMAEDEGVTFERRVRSAGGHVMVDHIRMNNQRQSEHVRVDMFSRGGWVDLQGGDEAVINFKYVPFRLPKQAGGVVDSEGRRCDIEPSARIVDDFREHFPEFEDFIDFIIAARFASDRKKAFLWLNCVSDWGKNFLIDLFATSGGAVEVSVKEIEKMFEGGAVGKSPNDFKRAWALVVDEFKTVKSEIKQIQNTITLSPKYQLSCKVDVYAKIFMSAEDVQSLVGEHGVEKQFLNRFSVIRGSSSIEAREVWKEVGKTVYFRHLQAYVLGRLNNGVREYVALGEDGAGSLGSERLTGFHERYGLGNHHESVDEALPDVVEDLRHYFLNSDNMMGEDPCVIHHEGATYLIRPARSVSDRLHDTVGHSEKVSLGLKVPKLISALDVSGKGEVFSRRIHGTRKLMRCIMLEKAPTTEEELAQF